MIVEVTVELRNGDTLLYYVNDFIELDNMIAWEEVVEIHGRTIRTKDMRQGKETRK